MRITIIKKYKKYSRGESVKLHKEEAMELLKKGVAIKDKMLRPEEMHELKGK